MCEPQAVSHSSCLHPSSESSSENSRERERERVTLLVERPLLTRASALPDIMYEDCVES